MKKFFSKKPTNKLDKDTVLLSSSKLYTPKASSLPAKRTVSLLNSSVSYTQPKKLKAHHYLIAIVICAIVFLASLGGMAYANWVVDDDTNTHVSTTTLDIEVITDTTPATAQYPGADITRHVYVKNTGSDGVFVRIKVPTAFDDGQGSVIDDAGNLIQVSFDPTHWKDGSDGYYYLKGVLEPGKTSESCIQSITLSTAITNDLAGYAATINPQAEALQVPGDAIINVWGKSYEFMEAKQRDPREEGQSHITFVDPTTGFTFIPNNKDIFPTAKGLVPGESVTSTVLFTNAHNEVVDIIVNSGIYTATSEIELFAKHATLTITDVNTGKTIYNGPAAGPQWEAFAHIHKLQPGAEATWKIVLALSGEAPNELQGVDTNYFSWDLQAKLNTDKPDPPVPPDPPGPDPKPTPTPTPTPTPPGPTPGTGDSPLLIICAIAAFVSGLVLLICTVMYRRQKRGDNYDSPTH